MQKQKRLLGLLMLVVLTALAACEKGFNPKKGAAELKVNKPGQVKKGEPVVLTLKNAPSETVSWQVSPAANVLVSKSGNSASFQFANANTYIVSATSGDDIDSAIIAVSDEVFDEQGGEGLIPLTGDEIVLTPAFVDSGSHSALMIAGNTMKTYSCMNNFLVTAQSENEGNYTIEFKGVYQPASGQCIEGNKVSSAMTFCYPLNEGSHGLKVMANGNIYEGSVTRTGRSVVINWPYTTGVRFSKLQLD